MIFHFGLSCLFFSILFGPGSSRIDHEYVPLNKIYTLPKEANATLSEMAEEALEGIKTSKKYDKRPLYVFGHMANTIVLVKDYLYDGANSIECDIKFHDDGQLDVIQHGTPCDLDLWLTQDRCELKEEVTTYLNFMRSVSQKGENIMS